MKNLKLKKNGFTMIEVLVVVTIIGVLASIGIVSYQTTNKKSRDSRRKADIEEIRAALEMCRADTGSYPEAITLGGSLQCSYDSITNTYLDPIPHDPLCPEGSCIGDHSDYSYIQTANNSYTITAKMETEGDYVKKNP